jgi:hypothetical protein
MPFIRFLFLVTISSRLIPMMQTLSDGEFALTKIPITNIEENHLTTDVLRPFNYARPIDLSWLVLLRKAGRNRDCGRYVLPYCRAREGTA